MANWTSESQPFGPNRQPLLTGLSILDGTTPVPVAVDPTTGKLQVSSSGAGTTSTNLTQINGNTVATAANGLQEVALNDGSNTANVVAGDSGFNGVATAQAAKTMSFSSTGTGAQTIGPFNAEGYSWIEIVTSSVGTGLTLTGGQFSPTSGGTFTTFTTWINSNGGTNAANSALSASTASPSFGPIKGNWFQIAVSALSSGTYSGTITLRATAPPIPLAVNASQNGTWTVGSNSATGSAVPANAFYVGMNNSGNLMGLTSVGQAGFTGVGASQSLASGTYIYNGTNTDLLRNATAVSNTTGAGLLGVGLLEWDGTNYQRVPSARFAPSSTVLNTYSVHLTTNATTTPTSATAYISSIAISAEVGGTTSSITIQDKQGTPLKLINGLATTAVSTTPTIINFQTPVKMVSGIDIITAGAVAGTVDVWINFYQ